MRGSEVVETSSDDLHMRCRVDPGRWTVDGIDPTQFSSLKPTAVEFVPGGHSFTSLPASLLLSSVTAVTVSCEYCYIAFVFDAYACSFVRGGMRSLGVIFKLMSIELND